MTPAYLTERHPCFGHSCHGGWLGSDAKCLVCEGRGWIARYIRIEAPAQEPEPDDWIRDIIATATEYIRAVGETHGNVYGTRVGACSLKLAESIRRCTSLLTPPDAETDE